MKKEKICIEHHCEDCGKDLVSRWSNWGIIIVFLILMLPMVISMLLNLPENKQCYTREYISGRGTDFEVLRNKDIKCPN